MSIVRSLVAEALRRAEATPDVRELEPDLAALLAVLTSPTVSRAAAVSELLGLLVPSHGEIQLGQPGVVEILEFTMRELRWPEVRAELRSIAERAADWRTIRAAERVLECYQEIWPGGEIYRRYESEP